MFSVLELSGSTMCHLSLILEVFGNYYFTFLSCFFLFPFLRYFNPYVKDSFSFHVYCVLSFLFSTVFALDSSEMDFFFSLGLVKNRMFGAFLKIPFVLFPNFGDTISPVTSKLGRDLRRVVYVTCFFFLMRSRMAALPLE